jgi:hypothetical protein
LFVKNTVISGDINVRKKDAEIILRYKHLTTEVERMWNVKTKLLTVIIGENETALKSVRKYLNNIARKHKMKELRERAILGTAHVLREALI